MEFIHSIVSTGTQYIDTGFKPNQDTRIVIDLAVVAASAQCALFGARNAYGSGAFNVFTSNNNNGYQDDYGAAIVNQVGGISSGRHTIDKNKNVLSVDGEIVNTSTYTSFTGSYSALLLSINNGGSAMTAYPVSAKLYSAQVYDNGALVRDLWPCIDNNGVVCMYDKVNSAYYYNAGTGEFVEGFPPVLFKRRPLAETAKPVSVEITGTGNADKCYATINGTTYTAAASGIEVMPGDTVSLYCKGGAYGSDGTISIDGTTVVDSNNSTKLYEWSVPEGISNISIKLSFGALSGSITVTTS